jgi:hypothetical protein
MHREHFVISSETWLIADTTGCKNRGKMQQTESDIPVGERETERAREREKEREKVETM